MIAITVPLPAKLVAASLASAVLLSRIYDQIGWTLTGVIAVLPAATSIADIRCEKSIEQLGTLISALEGSHLPSAGEFTRAAMMSRVRARRTRNALWILTFVSVVSAVLFKDTLLGMIVGGLCAVAIVLSLFESARTLDRAIDLTEKVRRDLATVLKRREALAARERMKTQSPVPA